MRAWRLLLVPPRQGAENMARDRGLMDRARETGEAVFSIYGWEAPTLSLGRNQAARGMYDRAEIARRGIDVVRRPTGGRALLHHREITYSVAAPVQPDESLAGSYGEINRMLIRGLGYLGVEVGESPGARQGSPGTAPCFAMPAAGELVTNGGKLVGSAQVREEGAFLQHGSILIDDDQAIITELLVKPENDVVLPKPATLRGALGRDLAVAEAAQALFRAVADCCGSPCSAIPEDETAEFTARHVARFESELWTWRR